jgi:hypothetical protein
MAEAYALTRNDKLRPVVAKAVRIICDGQTDEGGWYYGYAKKKGDGAPWKGGDTSVSGWQVQALTAAWHAGIRFKDGALRNACSRVPTDIRSRFDSKTGCGYQGTGPTRTKEENYATTGVGTFCLQLVGQGDCAAAKLGLRIMKTYDCSWEDTKGGPFGPLYGWYYITLAMYHAGPDPRLNECWQYWNPLFRDMLIAKQNKDGTWDYPPKGAQEMHNFTGRNRPIYPTAMCCLMLESYYRYAGALDAYRRARPPQ